MSTKGIVWIGCVAMAAAGCTSGSASDDGISFDTGVGGADSVGMTSNASGADEGAPAGTGGGSATSGSDPDGMTSSMTDDDDGSGIKLDVTPAGDFGGPCEGEGCGDGCTGVDLLFVIDNSVSMGGYQNALGIAFPAFAATLDQALPPGTNLHVGVTSTEMGFSGSGSTSISGGICSFTGDGGQPNDAFYITPDMTDSGRNGAQGRLYDPGGGMPYFEYVTGGGGAQLDALEAWFGGAANIGTSGSTIEMSTAPVGWVADPINSATNAGFVRDEGSVFVVFFMQDEPDQTPSMIDGQPGGLAMLDRLVAAKSGCGGLDCIIAGGFLVEQACSVGGNLPLDDFLANMTQTPVVQELPDENLAQSNPQAAADQMNMALSGTLTEVIAQTCEQIPPVG